MDNMTQPSVTMEVEGGEDGQIIKDPAYKQPTEPESLPVAEMSSSSLEGKKKKNGNIKSDDAEEGGTWGLVIIFAAFMIQVFTFGTATSIGVYNVEFLEYFNNDITGVALLTSLNIAFFMGAGPLANFVTNKSSHRVAVMIGAGLTVIGVFCMAWLDSLRIMIIFYGVLAGLGFCLSYVPSHVLSGLYYNKYRSLATGLATSGSGLGTAIFPPLVSYLIEEYAWRGSLVIVAGLNLHIFVFGLLLLPPPPKPKEEDEDIEPGDLPPEFEEKLSKKQFLKKRLCVFCDFGFDIYFLSNILWNCGSAVYIAFAPDFFKDNGLDKMEASFMLTLFGLGEFIGGIIGGILGNIPEFNRIYIYIAVNVVGGVMVFLFPLIEGYASFGSLSFFFGLCFGIILGLLIIVMTDLLGDDRIGDGLAYLMIADGVGAFCGPPVAGIFKDMFGGYEQALYFSGIALFVAGFISLLIPLQKRICRDDPEGQEKTSGRKCAQYNLSKIESSSSLKGQNSQVERIDMQKRDNQGDYSAVDTQTSSPEHRLADAQVQGPGIENPQFEHTADHETVKVVVDNDDGGKKVDIKLD